MALLLLFSSTLRPAEPRPDYRLVFNEEFNTLSLDPTGEGKGVWTPWFVRWSTRTLPANGEQQIYMDPAYRGTGDRPLGINPFRLRDGVLSIEARPTPAAAKPQLWNMPYTSGMLSTEKTAAWTYGFFEMRARMPAGKGLWPAFWLLPVDGSWPPEIDIVETLGHEPTIVHQSLHGEGHGTRSVTLRGKDITQWHIYGLEWTPDSIAWHLDGAVTHRVPNTINRPMFMVINLAVGGHWPGNPDAATRFPARLDIDYVRVFTKTGR